MALGFLSGWQIAVYLCKRTHQNFDQLSMLLTWVMIAAIIGARGAYVIEHWHAEFAHQPMAILRLDQGGLMFYGGLFTGLIPYIGYTLYYRKNFFEIADLSAAVIPLGHAFGRMGCFFHGCCFGKRCDTGFGLSFPKGSPAWWEQLNANLISENALKSLPVIPTQLIESSANLCLFLCLFLLYPKRHAQRGFVTGCYLCGYAIMRFFIEYLRGDPRATLGPFSISQTISLLIFIAGLGCMAYSRRYLNKQG